MCVQCTSTSGDFRVTLVFYLPETHNFNGLVKPSKMPSLCVCQEKWKVVKREGRIVGLDSWLQV